MSRHAKPKLTPITDQQLFATVTVWGAVDAGTRLKDTDGNSYLVGHQNESGFLALRSLTNGRYVPEDENARAKDLAFESLDHVDHSRFSIAHA